MDDENNNQDKNGLLNQKKQAAKAVLKKKIIAIGIKIAIPVILVIFAGAMLLGVFDAVGEVVQEIIKGVTDFFVVDNEGRIEISQNQIDSIINGITDLGISMDGLKLMGDVDYNDPDVQKANQEALRKYIKAFYEAEAMTQTLNTKPDWLESWTAGDKPYGTVYVHRTNEEDEVKPTKKNQLEYISYEEMLKKQQKGDKDITKYFSVDEEGKLVYAGWTTTVVKKDGKEVRNETVITLKRADYKNVISQYTTSMNFFLYLAMVTENPEFVMAVTDLVRESEIRITILDSDSVSYTKETYSYTLNTETKVRVPTVTYGKWDTEHKYPYTVYKLETYTNAENKKEVTETTTTSKIPTIAVTYVKTWFCEQTINYNRKKNGPNKNSDSTTMENETKPPLSGEGSVSWKTNQKNDYQTTTTTENYEEGTRGDVIDKTGEKGDGKKSFIGLLDVKFKIPNTTRYDNAGGNLVSGAEMLFYLLQKDPSSQNLEEVLRYILYKYTGRSYGVTDLDLSIYNARDFATVGGGGNLSAFGSTLTREEFIAKGTAYNGGSDYQTYMVPYLGDFYDICTKYNVNPVIAFAHACLETGYGSSSACKNNKNYFGYAHYNDASSGKRYATVADSIEDYCKWVVKNATVGTSAYTANYTTAQEYATANEALKGTPDTNIYILYCRYAYLGDKHYCDEPSFASPAGTDYYLSHGSTWGKGGRVYIYEMYEKGALYTGEYATRCGHSKASDPTTTAERADYAVYTTNKRIQIAQAIFGENVFFANFNVETLESGGYKFPHYLQKDYPGSYGTSTIPNSGCGPTSLAMVLAGLKNDPTINPQTVVENIKAYWPDGSYYVAGVGSSHCIFSSAFLQKYYGVTSQTGITETQALDALEKGYPVIGGEDGHILAIVPVPDTYKNQGYKFYILDSARGHDGAYKSVADANKVVKRKSKIYRYNKTIRRRRWSINKK